MLATLIVNLTPEIGCSEWDAMVGQGTSIGLVGMLPISGTFLGFDLLP